MIRHLLLIAVLVSLSSCDFNPPPAEDTSSQPATSEKIKFSDEDLKVPQLDTIAYSEPYVDSFKIEMDSLMKAKIKLPPIYTYEILKANEDAATKFDTLAKASRGSMKILVNSSVVAAEVEHTINKVSVAQSDLLILIDKTGSMADDIENIKASLSQIIDTIKRYRATRLAIAFFGDKNCDGLGWYNFRNFETNYEEAEDYLNSITANGGGDWPESVYDAVMKSFEQDFWRSARRRNIILVGDAPPLEKPYSDYNLSDVMKKAKEGTVVMNFYPIIIMPEISKVKMERKEIEKYETLKLTTALYPNPSTGQITVGFRESGTYYMEIYNSAGEAVLSEETFGLSWTKDLGNVPDGMYILRIINAEHKFELIKFIVHN